MAFVFRFLFRESLLDPVIVLATLFVTGCRQKEQVVYRLEGAAHWRPLPGSLDHTAARYYEVQW